MFLSIFLFYFPKVFLRSLLANCSFCLATPLVIKNKILTFFYGIINHNKGFKNIQKMQINEVINLLQKKNDLLKRFSKILDQFL